MSHLYPAAGRAALPLLLLLAALTAPALQAQPHEHHAYHILKLDDQGRIVCMLPTEDEVRQLRPTGKRGLPRTIVHPTNRAQALGGFRILLRVTDQLLDNPEALLAFQRAAARWEHAIDDDITAVIDIDYGPERFGVPYSSSNVLGSTFSLQEVATLFNGASAGVADMVDALTQAHPDDTQLQALYNAIPVPTPSTAGEDLETALGTQINLQALGFRDPHTDPDLNVNAFGDVPNIGFNSNFNFDLDPSDGITQGQFDFDAVAVHEIGHALGFSSIIGGGGPPNNLFLTWDLFRVRPKSVDDEGLDGFSTTSRVVTPGPVGEDSTTTENGVVYRASNHVFYDGLEILELSTGDPAGEGGDGRQAAHWRDNALRPPSLGDARYVGIMDPTISSSVRRQLNENDLRMLQVIGYQIDFDTTTARLFVAADDEVLDLQAVQPVRTLGLFEEGSRDTLVVTLANEHPTNTLRYSVSLDQGEDGVIVLEDAEGSLPPGAEVAVRVIAEGTTPGVFGGTLRIDANDNHFPLVLLPFLYTVYDASAARVALSEDDLGDLGTLTPGDVATRTVTLTNTAPPGNEDLAYIVLTTLESLSNPTDDTGTLEDRFGAENLSVVYQTDFEADAGGFEAEGVLAEDWRRVTDGAATMTGHTQPTAAYFGQVLANGLLLRYRNNADARLISPAFDFSALPTQDLVVLTFDYFFTTDDEADIANVLVSFDDGVSFSTVATSGPGGILEPGTDWQTLSLDIPSFSGFPSPVRVAFEFISDDATVGEGWYVDDVTMTVVSGASPAYPIPRAGVLAPGASETITLHVEETALEVGDYQGNLILLTNDPTLLQVNLLFNFSVSETTALEPADGLPITYGLLPNYPNPFNPTTTLRFTLPATGPATLQVFDLLGRRVATLYDDVLLPAGTHAVPFEAGALPSGVYLVRLAAGSHVATRRITLVK